MITTFSIIGCGTIAQRHAGHIARLGKLVSVCDVIEERADELAALYGANAFYTIEAMLAAEKADVLAVCTPNGLHAIHTIKALEAGMHVLCEKPMAITVKDCMAMIAAAERSGKQLFLVKQNRFNPPVQAVKKLLDDGRLGRISSIQLNCFWNRDAGYYRHSSWKGSLALDGGTLFTQFSHFIDLLYWMIGDIKQVHSLQRNYTHTGIIEFEDAGVAIMEFTSGTIGTLHYTVNSHAKNMEGSLTLFAEKATIKIGGEYLNRIDYQNIEGYTIPPLPDDKGANQYGSYQGSMSNHDKVYESLIAFLQTGAVYYTTPFEGMKTVEMIGRIYGNDK